MARECGPRADWLEIVTGAEFIDQSDRATAEALAALGTTRGFAGLYVTTDLMCPRCAEQGRRDRAHDEPVWMSARADGLGSYVLRCVVCNYIPGREPS